MHKWLLGFAMLVAYCMAQRPLVPDLEAQRLAMKKLSFLTGRWSGEARIFRRPGETVELSQTEEAQYKLDGLVLMIEGVGRNKSDGKIALQALGLISFDDTLGKYRMRAFNDGRFMETDLILAEDGNGLRWGFSVGEVRTSSVLHLNENREWTEHTEIRVGSQPARKFMELRDLLH